MELEALVQENHAPNPWFTIANYFPWFQEVQDVEGKNQEEMWNFLYLGGKKDYKALSRKLNLSLNRFAVGFRDGASTNRSGLVFMR